MCTKIDSDSAKSTSPHFLSVRSLAAAEGRPVKGKQYTEAQHRVGIEVLVHRGGDLYGEVPKLLAQASQVVAKRLTLIGQGFEGDQIRRTRLS